MGNEHDFDLLVHKNLTGQISNEEKQLLENQLHGLENKVIAQNLESIWEAAQSLPTERQFDAEKAKLAFFNKINERNKAEVIQMKPIEPASPSKLRWLYYAVSIASLFIIGFFALNKLNTGNDQVIYASGQMTQKIEMPDGSKVVLSPNSELVYDKATYQQTRHISLKGIALFEVAKTGNPFVVYTDNYEVLVMGTTFTVETGIKKNVVKVLEGKVKVKPINSNKNLIITDRQGVNINNGEIQLIENVDFTNDKWIDPEMSYLNTPLSKVVSDIETKFGVKFEFTSNQIAQICNFSSGGSLKEQSLEQVIAILESTFDTKIHKKEGNILVFQSLNCK